MRDQGKRRPRQCAQPNSSASSSPTSKPQQSQYASGPSGCQPMRWTRSESGRAMGSSQIFSMLRNRLCSRLCRLFEVCSGCAHRSSSPDTSVLGGHWNCCDVRSSSTRRSIFQCYDGPIPTLVGGCSLFGTSSRYESGEMPGSHAVWVLVETACMANRNYFRNSDWVMEHGRPGNRSL